MGNEIPLDARRIYKRFLTLRPNKRDKNPFEDISFDSFYAFAAKNRLLSDGHVKSPTAHREAETAKAHRG